MRYLFLTILILSALNMFSNELKLNPMRLTTDYNGVSGNEHILMCYGNYGIITYSEDFGETWKQLTIGDKHNILKILEFQDVFYAVSEFSLFYSENGKIWTEINISNNPIVLDLTLIGETAYIQTSESILKLNSENKISEILELDTELYYQDFCSDSKYLYVLEGTDEYITKLPQQILRINSNELQIDTLELDINLFCDDCNGIKAIDVWNDSLYITISRYYQEEHVTQIVTNYYLNSKVFSRGISSLFVFLSNTNDLYFWSPKRVKISEQIYVNSFDFYKVIDTLNYEVITDTSDIILKTHRKDPSSFTINEIQKFDNGFLLAAGTNKTILLSKDLGVTWELISNYQINAVIPLFNAFQSRSSNTMLSKSNYLISHNYREFQYFQSKDGGIIWLPPELNQNTLEIYSKIYTNYGYPMFYYNFEKSNGFMWDTHKSVKFSSKESFYDYEIIMDVNQFNAMENTYDIGIENKNEIIFGTNIAGAFTGDGANIFTRFYIFDTNYNMIDSSRVDSTLIYKPIVLENGNLMAFSVIRSEYFKNDNSSGFKDIRQEFLLSSDNGRTWYNSEIKVPIPLELLKYPSGDYYYNKPYPTTFQYKDYIIIPKGMQDSTIAYYYDMTTERFDSLHFPVQINMVAPDQSMFEFQEEFYFVGINFKIYHTKNFGDEIVVWDSIDVSEYFYDWHDFDYYANINTQTGKDAIYGVTVDSNQIYLTLGKFVTKSFDIAVAKLFEDSLISSIEEPKIESEINYLYLTDVYPNPSSNTSKIKVYTTSSSELNESSIKIFDIYGRAIKVSEITLNPINLGSTEVQWTLNNIQTGIYFIQVSLNGKIMAKPFVVSR